MQLRQNAGARPQITFTSDFHELVEGDLVPGPCVLRYDPLRLVSLGDAAQAVHHIRAYMRLHPVGVEWQHTFELPAGLPLRDLADISGQGFMLTAIFELPPGCDELEVWFSCTHDDGETHWDSDFGRNHWLRFGLSDLAIRTAKICPRPGNAAAQESLQFEIATKAAVESVAVRWRITSDPGFSRRVSSLVVSAATPAGKTWSSPDGGIPVPNGATVAFDVVYQVDQRSFTDDNQGRWYIAD